MNSHTHPPQFLELIVNWLAPRHVKEDLLGDLLEEYYGFSESDCKKAKRVYFNSVIRLIPFLIISRMSEMKSRVTILSFSIAIGLLSLVVTWESLIVQNQSWPLTARFSDSSFLHARALYFTIYNSLFILGVGVVFAFNCSSKKVSTMYCVHPYTLATTLMIVPVINMLFPQPLDSYWMRGFQVITLWCLAMFYVNQSHAKST